MRNVEPDWGIWKHMPSITGREAVALSFGVNPRKLYHDKRGWAVTGESQTLHSLPEFADRLTLFERVHGSNLPSPPAFSAWALSVGWNIPLKLARFSGYEAEQTEVSTDAELNARVDAALADVVASGTEPSELRVAIEAVGHRFFSDGGELLMRVQDGTVRGKTVAVNLQAVSELYSHSSEDSAVRKLGNLIRASGARGGSGFSGQWVVRPSASPTAEVSRTEPPQLVSAVTPLESGSEVAGDIAARASHETTAPESKQGAPATVYQLPMFQRLQPHSLWTGGRITDTDLINLDEAAEMATRHAGETVTVSDFLRAGARGEILLRAIAPRDAVMQSVRSDDRSSKLPIPRGSIPTLPLVACEGLAAVGVAYWRTFDDFEPAEAFGGVLSRFTRWALPEGEPDLKTTVAD